MAIDLEQQFVRHRGETGRGREEAIRKFLRKHLPRRFEIADGFAFDHEGAESEQLDIVIANPLAAPTFETEGGLRLFPIESVVGVGQVRTNVTSESTLIDALENLASVGRLDRSANGTAICRETMEPLHHTEDHLDRVFTFLVITGRSLSGERIRALLLEYVTQTECHMWPNMIVALDRFVLTYACDGGACPNTMDARGFALIPGRRARTLVQFYLFLAQALETTRVGSVPFHSYLAQLNQNATITFSTRNLPDEPPPYLASLIWTSGREEKIRAARARARGRRDG